MCEIDLQDLSVLTLPLEQKRTSLRALAANARVQLAGLLGPDASAAFSSRSEHLFSDLEQGRYAVFDESGTSFQTIEPSPPPPPNE
jgi:hypothetical protein